MTSCTVVTALWAIATVTESPGPSPTAVLEPSKEPEVVASAETAPSSQDIVVQSVTKSKAIPQQKLTGATLERVQGDGLGRALASMPGVAALSAAASGMTKPVIRGQVGRRNLILFDGVRHEGQKWGIDHAPEIDPHSAGKITLYKGAATTRFGADAIGGAVSIEPPALPRNPGISAAVKTMGRANTRGGDVSVRFDHVPQRLPSLAWRVSGSFARHGPSMTPYYPLDNTGQRNWNAGGRIAWQGQHIRLLGSYAITEQVAGICTCLRISTEEEFLRALERDEPIALEHYDRDGAIDRGYQHVQHHLGLIRGEFEFGRAGTLLATYTIQDNGRREFDVVRKGITGAQLELKLTTHALDLEFSQPTANLTKGWRFEGSGGVHFSFQDNQVLSYVSPVPTYRRFRGSVFVLERLTHARGEFEIGARYTAFHRRARLIYHDFINHFGAGKIARGMCVRLPDREGASCEHRFHVPSASLGATVRPVAKASWLNMGLQLDASGRTPAIDEHYMNNVAPSFPILGLGDPSLGIERTWGTSVSTNVEHPAFGLEASGYANFINDFVYFRPARAEGPCAPASCSIQGPFRVFEFHAIDARFLGGEVSLHIRPPSMPFEVHAQASWVRGVQRDTGTVLSFQPADRYELVGLLKAPDGRFVRNGYVEMAPTYVFSYAGHDEAGDFAPPPPSYFTLGVGVGFEVQTPASTIRMGLRGTNLLNQRLRNRLSLLRYFADEPGWDLQLRVSMTFDRGIGSE